MSDLLQNLVATPHAALVADADFLDPQGDPMVVFIIEDDGNLDTQLHTALGRLGVACIIDLVDGRGDAPDAYPVYMNPVSIVCEVSEKVLMNRTTGQVAGTDYLTLRQALGMIIDKMHLQHGLVFESFRSAQPPKGADAAYQIFFNTSEVLENTRRVLPVLQSLEIVGAAAVASDSTEQYALVATYDDATTADVTASAIWAENSGLASVALGLLTVGTLPTAEAASLFAAYGGLSATLDITLQAELATLQGLEITGPTTVAAGESIQLTATGTYSDGSTADLTNSVTWSDDVAGSYTLVAGLLTSLVDGENPEYFEIRAAMEGTPYLDDHEITLEAAFIPVWTDYIASIVDTVSYDTALNAIFALDNNPETFEISAPGINYSYAGYYAHVGLEAAGVTLTDDGLDAELYPAADYLNLGAELIDNGGFDDPVTEWGTGEGWDIYGGAAHKVAGTGSYLTQDALPAGSPILVSFDLTRTSTAGSILFLDSHWGDEILAFTESGSFICESKYNVMYNYSTASFIGTIDNISARKVLPGPYVAP